MAVTNFVPDIWSARILTNLCSDDGDCAGVGIEFNIGKELRDLTGFDFIEDANIDYAMSSCASVGIGNTSCGVCVPCQDDSDCAPIDIDAISGDLFGPVGGIVAAFLLDQMFGQNEHQVNMYCQAVAGGYGVCAPCPGLIYECGTTGGGGGGGGGGTCDHDTCTAGGPLDASCGSCEADMCAYDAYCCGKGAYGSFPAARTLAPLRPVSVSPRSARALSASFVRRATTSGCSAATSRVSPMSSFKLNNACGW